MIPALFLLPLVAATPLHKYPYVFLLDVGNEELEKVNSEQIRLSSPGGSVALRYPAVGSGDDIAHVRVSGIDFGTDLKANILDGGPGYKYVVIVLTGNPGTAYDAVITVQTVPNEVSDDDRTSIEDIPKRIDKYRPIVDDDSEEANNSAEEYDSVESETSQVRINPKNEELSQESPIVYYSQNEALNGYGNENSDNESENYDNNDEQNEVYEKEETDNSENEDYDNGEDSRVKKPLAERYTSNDYDQGPVIVDQNLYNKYQALKSHFNGIEVYPQDADINDGQSDIQPVDTEVNYEYEESDEWNYGNANYKDTDDATAVEF